MNSNDANETNLTTQSSGADEVPPSIMSLNEALQDVDLLASGISKTPKSFLFYQEADDNNNTSLSLMHLQKQNAAAQRVQTWFRYWTAMRKLQQRFHQYFDRSTVHGSIHHIHCQSAVNHLYKLLELIDNHTKSSNNAPTHGFEYVQSLLFSEVWLKSMVSVFNAFPTSLLTTSAVGSFSEADVSVTSTKEKLSATAIVKNISSAFLIALFPEDCLALSGDTSSPRPNSTPVELRSKGKECEVVARLLQKRSTQLLSSFNAIVKSFSEQSFPENRGRIQIQKLYEVVLRFNFSVSAFATTFKEWKALDSIRMVKSLEETFTQSYATLIAAKVELMLGNADPRLVHSAESQVEKIKSILLKILGQNKGMSRIEEICAEVEISNAHYSRLMMNENSSKETSISRQNSISGLNPDNVVNATVTVEESASGKARNSSALSPSQAPIGSNNKSDDEKTMKYLEMLSQLAGIENERLAHELTLDKHYRLPLHSSTSAVLNEEPSTAVTTGTATAAVKDAKSLAEFLKQQMLAAIADKLCNSLRKSNVQSIHELRVGMIVPVRIVSASAYHKSIPVYSAKIVKIVDSRTNSSLESIADCQKDDDAETADDRDITQVVWLQIEFMVERSTEEYVSLDRVKLATEASDPIPLIEALADVCHSIAALTPNRPDLQAKVLKAYDPELLQQILEKDIVDPLRDLWPILLRIQKAVIELQAEYRVELSERWLKQFEIAFHGSSMETNNQQSSIQATDIEAAKRLVESGTRRTISLLPSPVCSPKGRTMDDVLPLIPLFLERTVECVEEIQRDMANYYISLLVPVLEKHGHEFLSKRFKMRLQQKMISLDKTANMIMSQLTPPNQIQAMVADLVEAEACPPMGFTLEDLLTPQSPASPTTPTTPSSSSLNHLFKGVIARGILSILQAPVRLDSSNPMAMGIVPETLVWDRNRLATIRDLVDTIALETSIVITTKQLLHRYQVIPRESEEIELQHRLDVLLSTTATGAPSSASSSSATNSLESTSSSSVDISNIIIEIVNYVQFAIYRTRESTVSLVNYNNNSTAAAANETPKAQQPNAIGNASSAWMNYDLKEMKDRVDKAIRDVVSDGNPVLALFTKRVYKVLLRSMLGKPYLQKLSSYSLQSKGQERNLSRLMEITTKLFNHTIKVHGDIYKALVGTLASSALQPTPQRSEQSI